jgi:hypothetical protein
MIKRCVKLIETIKIEFTEQAKAIVANTKLEVTGDVGERLNDDAILERAKQLFEVAHRYADTKTKQKIKAIAINTKFFIIDQEQVLFYLADGGIAEEETAIWLNTPFFTNALVYLFNQIWGE